MMCPLRIKFDGMVAIGPPYPLRGSLTSKGPLFGVMPLGVRQQTRKSKLKFKSHPTYTNVHIPVILTKMDPDLNGRLPDETVNGWKIWYPMRERMELSFDGHGEPGVLKYEHSPSLGEYCTQKITGPPGVLPLTDIAAVSDMREVWPARAKLRKKMLRRRPPREVAAQVFVPYGLVSGDGPYYSGVPVEYLPPRTEEPVRKCALQQVVVTVEVERFEIAMYSLETGEQLDGLSFTLTEENSEILIGNADAQDIRDTVNNPPKARDTHTEPFAAGKADLDFELYYNILDGFDDGGPLPIPYYPTPFGLRPCYTTLVNGG
jgi:hypothetical protein